MNRVELTGGLVRDPELRYTPGGAPVCEFTVAVNEAGWNAKERKQDVFTTFVSVQAWMSLAEQIAERTKERG